MADVLADMPGVWRRLLAAHVPDRWGRCRGCRGDIDSGERWPCSLNRIAAEARRLHEGAGTGDRRGLTGGIPGP